MGEKREQGKYIGIRIQADELEQVDAAAKEHGLNRTDYVRSCLNLRPVLSSTDELERLADLLRQLQIGQSAYVQALRRALYLLDEQERGSSDYGAMRTAIMNEMAHGAELQELFFRCERRTVRLLRKFQGETD